MVDGEYNLFYYFGSDFHSTTRFGFSGKAEAKLKYYYKKRGYSKSYDTEERNSIFNKEGLIGHYSKYTGSTDGIKTNIYILLGNPDGKTPKSRYEYFRFMKHAFKYASGINYIGHSGLGTNLYMDALEELYSEKIEYRVNHKQLIVLSGCSTYLQSSGFFFEKKPNQDSLVLITNGLPIFTKLDKSVALTLADTFHYETEFTNKSLFEKLYKWIGSEGATRENYPMSAVESN